MKNFGIKEALKTLGIKSTNAGVSTGTKWLKPSVDQFYNHHSQDTKLLQAHYFLQRLY